MGILVVGLSIAGLVTSIWFMVSFLWYKHRVNKQLKTVKLLDGEWPVIGHALLMAGKKFDTPEDIYIAMKDIVDNIREDKRMWFLNHHFFGAASPETVEKILSSHGAIEKSYVYKASDLLMRGVLASPGYFWKPLRKRLNMTFNPKFVPQYVDQINHQSSIFLNKINHQLNQYQNIHPLVSQYFFDIITNTHFGVDTKQQSKHEANIAEIMVQSLKFQCKWMSQPWLQPTFIFIRSKLYQELMKIRNTFDPLLAKIAIASEEYQKEIDCTGNKTGWKSYSLHAKEILEELGINPTHRVVGNTVGDLIVAGADTTSVALATAIYYMGLHPEYQEIALQEIHQVLGDITINNKGDSANSPTNDFGTVNDTQSDWGFTKSFPDDYSIWTKNRLDRLEFCDMIIKEATRISSPCVIARYLTADINVGDYTIPKGTNAAILIRSLHRNPKYYEKPDEFYPDHFNKENVRLRPKTAFIPFSYGPRDCPGKIFGMYGMKCLLAELIRNFQIVTKPPEKPVKYKLVVMVEHSDGYPVKFLPRKIAS